MLPQTSPDVLFIVLPVQTVKLKSNRPDVFEPSDVSTRSLKRRSMFSSSLSTVSFNPDDWAPSVSTTLGYNTLALGGSIRSSPAAWCGCERGRLQPSSRASEWPCLWVIPPSELLLTACSQGEQLSLSVWLLLPWSWTACCSQAWGTACLVHKKKKQGEREREREKWEEEWKSIPH